MKLKKYSTVKIDANQLKINGKGDHPLWEKAISLTDFSSPWDDEIIKRIEFKALWDGVNLYCCFKVEDSKTYIDTTDNTKSSINNSDRVELFFRRSKALNPYYCLEIDPTPRLMDFKAKPNKEFDFNWNWPINDIVIKSHTGSTFFTVEIEISLLSLKNFELINNGQIEIGIFRAKYHQQTNGSYEPTWITWVDPKTETPNFHTAKAFGLMNLECFELH
ncbi:hypothetical protein APS56_12725 [Pseudalgibacter alginicilyticus]|uniref:Carbohydrate-binding domain-containing protein n=1 Tax=Pseudalgibacter alginicilyticus TaxID=1736674 RepID=A0A0N7HYQ9_9FLAO|nr:sugar-binding protein [Pseudalgibacter alginicilyticus]ALJ05942.1 hypothetical protein APS56_12725 [Pseudalgibacter alginicilyticus]